MQPAKKRNVKKPKNRVTAARVRSMQRSAAESAAGALPWAESGNESRAMARRVPRRRIRTDRGSMDFTFLILVLLLLSVGLIMLFSASYAAAYYKEGDSFYFITRQLQFAAVGIVIMLVVANIDYARILHRLNFLIFGFTIVLLILALLFPYRTDSKRWLNLGFTTFQPSELAKFAVVLMFAHLISINYDKMKNPKYGVVPFVGILGLVSVLMLLEPHLSGTILILTIGVVMMFVGGTDIKWFMLGFAGLAAVVIVLVLVPGVVPYALSRIEFWQHPENAPQVEGYQTLQSLYAIGSGGLFGVGIGNSRQKHLYLPEPQNDFVFSIVCEELGFVGAALIILLFVLLIWRGFVIAMRCRDKFGSMLAIGLSTQVGVQAILNIAVVSNTVPNTGISLPFFSYGGTALVMLLAEMGVVLSVSRHAVLEKE